MKLSEEIERVLVGEGIDFNVIRSKHNDEVYKVAILGKIGRIEFKGETLAIHGFDKIDHKLVNGILQDGMLTRIDGGAVTSSIRHKVRAELLKKLLSISESDIMEGSSDEAF